MRWTQRGSFVSLPPLLDLRGTAIELLETPMEWPDGDDWVDAAALASRLPDAAEQIGVLLDHLLEQATMRKRRRIGCLRREHGQAAAIGPAPSYRMSTRSMARRRGKHRLSGICADSR